MVLYSSTFSTGGMTNLWGDEQRSVTNIFLLPHSNGFSHFLLDTRIYPSRPAQFCPTPQCRKCCRLNFFVRNLGTALSRKVPFRSLTPVPHFSMVKALRASETQNREPVPE